MTSSGDNPPSQHLALDTSAYSHLRRRHPTMVAWLAACDVAEVSVVVIGELEAGFRLGSRYDENVTTLGDFLKEPFVRAQVLTPSIARRYGVIFSALRRAGMPIPVNDIWIAATALESGAHLVTFDSDFARVEGLAHTVLA